MRISGSVRATVFLTLMIGIEGCMQPIKDGSQATFRGDTGPIFCVAYSPNGKLLALGTGGFDARIWDAITGRELAVLEGHTDVITSVAFSPDSSVLAIGSGDGTVSLWDVTVKKRKAVLQCGGQVSEIAYSPDGKSLAVAYVRDVGLWDLSGDAPKEQTTLKTDPHTHEIVFDPSRGTLITLGGKGSVKIWDTRTGELRTSIQNLDRISAISLSQDGNVLAASGNSIITLMDFSQTKLTVRATIKAEVDCLALSPTGRILAAGLSQRAVEFWDASNGRELATLTGHTERINSVAFSPDGRTVASASDDRTVKLWAVPKP